VVSQCKGDYSSQVTCHIVSCEKKKLKKNKKENGKVCKEKQF